jgi:hypothetical protein
MQIADSGAIPLLMRLLASGISKSQEAALGALAALVKDNPELAQVIAQMRRTCPGMCERTTPQALPQCHLPLTVRGRHTKRVKLCKCPIILQAYLTLFSFFWIFNLIVEKGERPAPFILRLVRDKSPTMRLAAATWYVLMNNFAFAH